MSEICTWLYTPASSAEKLEKALLRGADAVIFDLEDAVHPDRKPSARQELREFLAAGVPAGASDVYVRVNALDSPWGAADLETVAELAPVQGVRVPKVETVTQVHEVASIVGPKELQVLIESATGFLAMPELCALPGVSAVSLGDNDLRAGLNLEGETVLDQMRGRLVLELAAAGKPAPTGSVYPRILDLEGLHADSVRLRRMGFFGRTVLHPMQLETVNEAFRPGSEDVEWALEVIEAASCSELEGLGAVMLPSGQFIDRPFLIRAETLLARAGIAPG